VMGPYKHGNKPSCSVKGGEFLDQVSNCQFLGKNCLLHGLSKLGDETNSSPVYPPILFLSCLFLSSPAGQFMWFCYLGLSSV
jgi:hypothetical protein